MQNIQDLAIHPLHFRNSFCVAWITGDVITFTLSYTQYQVFETKIGRTYITEAYNPLRQIVVHAALHTVSFVTTLVVTK